MDAADIAPAMILLLKDTMFVVESAVAVAILVNSALTAPSSWKLFEVLLLDRD